MSVKRLASTKPSGSENEKDVQHRDMLMTVQGGLRRFKIHINDKIKNYNFADLHLQQAVLEPNMQIIIKTYVYIYIYMLVGKQNYRKHRSKHKKSFENNIN